MKALVLLIILSITLNSCESSLFDMKQTSSPEHNFEVLWKEFDRHYSYFEYSNINWDSTYNVYRPKVNASTSNEELFDIMSEMINSLHDGHCNLYTPFNSSTYSGWLDGYQSNVVGDMANYFSSYSNINHILGFGRIKNSTIGYLKISTFMGNNSYFKAIDAVVDSLSNCSGLVIDLRSNGGGNSNNADTISSRFGDSTRVTFSIRYRNGAKHSDFTNWIDVNSKPTKSARFLQPIVLLTNRMCYSSAEWFTLTMKAFPNVTVIGDRTGGGAGNPLQKDLPNGWNFRFSNSQKRTLQGKDIQWVGIDPDIKAIISPEQEELNIDEVLETAIEYLTLK